MSLSYIDSSNRPRVLAALLGVGLVLAVTVVMGFVNQHQKPVAPVATNLEVLQTDVRDAVEKALHTYQVSGQMDPSAVAGMNSRMARGMSAWYTDDNHVRIARPGGCLAWVHKQQVSFNAACRK